MPKAVSIGFPSTINRARAVVVQTPNIACIPDDFAVVDALESALERINRTLIDDLLAEVMESVPQPKLV